MSAAIAKEFMGLCGGCGSRIEPGDWIVSRSNQTLHYECLRRAGASQASQQPAMTAAPLLFDDAPRQAVESVKRTIGATVIRFDGSNCSAADSPRLTGQLLRVFETMRHGAWRTVEEVAAETGDPETSVSAQLRNLRKPRFGAHTVNKRLRICNLWEYQLILRSELAPQRAA